MGIEATTQPSLLQEQKKEHASVKLLSKSTLALKGGAVDKESLQGHINNEDNIISFPVVLKRGSLDDRKTSLYVLLSHAQARLNRSVENDEPSIEDELKAIIAGPITFAQIAPERWKDRHIKSDDNKEKHIESPIEFFARVYRDRLKNLSRADLLSIDPELYRAINRSLDRDPERLSSFSENVRIALRTKSEIINEEIVKYNSGAESRQDADWATRYRMEQAAKRRTRPS